MTTTPDTPNGSTAPLGDGTAHDVTSGTRELLVSDVTTPAALDGSVLDGTDGTEDDPTAGTDGGTRTGTGGRVHRLRFPPRQRPPAPAGPGTATAGTGNGSGSAGSAEPDDDGPVEIGSRGSRRILAGVVIVFGLAVSALAGWESFFAFRSLAEFFGWDAGHSWTTMILVESFMLIGSAEMALRVLEGRGKELRGPRLVIYTALLITLAVNVAERVLKLILPHGPDGRMVVGELVEVYWWQPVALGVFASFVPFGQIVATKLLISRLQAMSADRRIRRAAKPDDQPAGLSVLGAARSLAARSLAARAARIEVPADPPTPVPPATPTAPAIPAPPRPADRPTPRPPVTRVTVIAPTSPAGAGAEVPAEWFDVHADKIAAVQARAGDAWWNGEKALVVDQVQKQYGVGNRKHASQVTKCLAALRHQKLADAAGAQTPDTSGGSA